MKRTLWSMPLALCLAMAAPGGALGAGGPVEPVQGSYIGTAGSTPGRASGSQRPVRATSRGSSSCYRSRRWLWLRSVVPERQGPAVTGTTFADPTGP